MKVTHSGNYQEDDNEFFTEFGDGQLQTTQEQVSEVDFDHNVTITGVELNSLYHLSGYCITRLVKHKYLHLDHLDLGCSYLG